MLSVIGNWLGQLDPNTVVPALSALVAWLWHRSSSKTQDSARAIVDLVIDNIARELDAAHDTFGAPSYDVPLFLKRSRAYIEERVWTALGKRGIRKTPTAEKLVHESTERATLWLADEFKQRAAAAKAAP